ncbi:hemin transporter [Streptomyces sp. SID8366]|uniref:globin domain-containing protein n=1 Tax=unclassified Streptomyces TaxID=2593676 RepID=UPI000DB9045C|nr:MULTISPECIES: globin domain-containing protein [unclassified Streptomyces]MYU08555.1 hemin transporter [Streptomyces sp. SID8366]MYU65061.1 hemin transporter [Streptomyces sp. SID69]RAJ62944.1 nitric oxide dioxygenase [Streptomyces sp. PsTaAH-130]
MLSEKSAATVRATLPAVGAAIEQITERFYARLFDAHPELLRDLFNRGNQASGAQKSALAGSIAAFAGYLVEHPDQRPDAMLGRIAHKHASLGVVPEQYPVVHEHLFAAIAEILGEAATPEVAAAWSEVYWLMANALIAVEKRLYEESGSREFREWEVVGREEETEDVVSFRVRPLDGSPVRGFRAGQYVSVGVKLADGARQIRQYSLSGAPGEDVRRFSVKRVHGGTTPEGEVSNQLHAHVRVGDVLQLSEPYGDLVLDGGAGRPLLLASAGIGVTPMVAMLASLAADGYDAPVTVLHGDRSPADHALRVDHRAYADKLADSAVAFFYERDAGPGDRTGLVDLSGTGIAPGTRAYLCGPLPFMRGVRGQLIERGVDPADIHYEVFGPDLWLAAR